MAVVAVPALIGRLVRAPEAGVVGTDQALARLYERRRELAVEERPGRLAVKADDGPPSPSET